MLQPGPNPPADRTLRHFSLLATLVVQTIELRGLNPQMVRRFIKKSWDEALRLAYTEAFLDVLRYFRREELGSLAEPGNRSQLIKAILRRLARHVANVNRNGQRQARTAGPISGDNLLLAMQAYDISLALLANVEPPFPTARELGRSAFMAAMMATFRKFSELRPDGLDEDSVLNELQFEFNYKVLRHIADRIDPHGESAAEDLRALPDHHEAILATLLPPPTSPDGAPLPRGRAPRPHPELLEQVVKGLAWNEIMAVVVWALDWYQHHRSMRADTPV